MSLQFVFGPAGSGKSKYLQEALVGSAIAHPEQKFLLIVPDQYNMQTQMDMILLHPDRAFSNIEVLSFSRLSHRILEEVGGENIPVLDDTGKSLIIRHISEGLRDKLTVMDSKLDKPGFVHEVKSAISEFMQYGINPDGVSQLASFSADRPALSYKLKDLEVIYRAFEEYKANKFLTREETLDIVRRSLHKSKLVNGATIIFDGFTGFTPIQEKVIEELMVLAYKVIISFELDEGMNPYKISGEQELFYLSKKSVLRLKKLADEASVNELEPVFLSRKENKEDLSHLEKYLFRYPVCTYEKEPERIHIYKALKIKDEIIDTFQRIRTLTDNEGLCYKDIAIVAGNLGEYADEIEEIAQTFDVPIYMDYSRSVSLSPFAQSIKSALEVVEKNLSIDSVIRHIRFGFTPITREECDELENYLLKTGKKGMSAYKKVWTLNYSGYGEESDEERDARILKMERLNSIRERFIQYINPLFDTKDEASCVEYCTALYEFVSKENMYGKLLKMSEFFEEKEDRIRASEYKQVYIKIMDLLDQMVALTGEEKMTRKEFAETLVSGFAEIKLGMIPLEIDRVIVGDMERSRLSNIKVLMFIGVNDGNIPGNVSGGGLISDLDREFLHGSDMELAPTPKEQMYIQRLYLYMNMTKPSEQLYISYAQMDLEGKSLRPSYLIESMHKLFPKLEIYPSSCTHSLNNQILPEGKKYIPLYYAGLIRNFAGGELSEADRELMDNLGSVIYANDFKDYYKKIKDVAFEHFSDSPLAAQIAEKLYGHVIQTSISRMEKFAACAYAHFLSYGLKLNEREEFSFERKDLGDIYHKVLEEFAKKLQDNNMSWADYSSEKAYAWVDEILKSITMTYGDTILLSSARSRAVAGRMNRILKRTVDILSYQLSKGQFIPEGFERVFAATKTIGKTEDGADIKIKVTGKVDRVDIYENDGKTYIKIIDYKSGNRDFDITSMYHGLQLQLPIYMKQACEMAKRTHPNTKIEPAAMLYYHIDDPYVESMEESDDELLMEQIKEKLKMKGIVSADREKIALLDSDLAGSDISSDIIPVSITKQDALSQRSSTLDDSDIDVVLDFAEQKLDNLALDILSGQIEIKPKCFSSGYMPCDYCSYKTVCKIDSKIPGYEPEILFKDKAEDIIEQIKNELH